MKGIALLRQFFNFREWNKELDYKAEAIKAGKKEYKPSLTKAIIRAFGPKFGLIGIFCGIEEWQETVFNQKFSEFG